MTARPFFFVVAAGLVTVLAGCSSVSIGQVADSGSQAPVSSAYPSPAEKAGESKRCTKARTVLSRAEASGDADRVAQAQERVSVLCAVLPDLGVLRPEQDYLGAASRPDVRTDGEQVIGLADAVVSNTTVGLVTDLGTTSSTEGGVEYANIIVTLIGVGSATETLTYSDGSTEQVELLVPQSIQAPVGQYVLLTAEAVRGAPVPSEVTSSDPAVVSVA